MAPKKKVKGKSADDEFLPTKRSKQYRGGSSNTRGTRDTEMSDQPDWAALLENQWPENTLPNYGLKLSPEDLETFESLKSKRFVQPKYVHIPTLQSLGILDEVQSLMSSLGIWDYCTRPFPAYRTLTIEFLSTINTDDERMVTYYLDGAKYSITLVDLNHIMGFPNNPEAAEQPN